jgi:hypothetical protein
MEGVDTVNYKVYASLFLSFQSTSLCNMFRPLGLHVAIIRQLILYVAIIRQLIIYVAIIRQLTVYCMWPS